MQIINKGDLEMVDKIITVQQNKDRRIARKIKKLREDWRKSYRGHQDCRIVKAIAEDFKDGE